MVQFKLPSKATYFASDSLAPLDMFKKILESLSKLAKLLGADIFSEGFTPCNFLFIFMVGTLLSFIGMALYELHLFAGDLFRVCFLFVSLSVAIQACCKIYIFMFQRGSILDLTNRMEKFIVNFNTEKANKIMEKWLMISAHIGVALVVTLVGSMALLFIYPLIFYCFTGERILHFGFELPFIDWHTNIGYTLNFFYSGFVLSLFVIAAFLTTSFSTMFVVMSFGQFELIKMLLDELDDFIKGNDKGQHDDEIKKHIALITDMHNELVDFLVVYEDIFKAFFLGEISCVISQSTMTLYAVLSITFIQGYFIIFFDAVEIFIPCLVGTFLMMEGDKYYANLCNINWHLLSLRDQKSISLLMVFAINPKSITMGLKVLNVESFLEIYQAIYSYLMALLSFT